jgi:hypothetical protein
MVLVGLVSLLAMPVMALPSSPDGSKNDEPSGSANKTKEPLNLAILIQDDLVSRVGNELKVTRDFIKSLPEGSNVMVGYITSGSLRVRQPFTTDLVKASESLRIPLSNSAGSPYDPYVEVVEALKKFDKLGEGRNAVLLISDGLDTSRGFDIDSAANTVDLLSAIKEAQRRHVAVYSFFAPAVGLTSWNFRAISYGQSSLSRLSKETGGRAFFQGTSFVTFDSYFKRLHQELERQYGTAY